MNVADIMKGNPISIRLDTEIQEIMSLMLDNEISAVPVLDGGRH